MECEACQRRREQRRLKQVHKYSTDEAYRHHRLKVCGEAYHRNPDLGRARSYLRQHQLGRIRRPNADLLERYEAVLRGSKPPSHHDPASPPGEETAVVG
jgi:hypothetical protein